MKLTQSEIELARVVLEGTGCWARKLTEAQVQKANATVQDAYKSLKQTCGSSSRVATVIKSLRTKAHVAPLNRRGIPPTEVKSYGIVTNLQFCTGCGRRLPTRSTEWRHCGYCGVRLTH